MNELLSAVQTPDNPSIPELSPGDAVSVHVKIKKETANVFRNLRELFCSFEAVGTMPHLPSDVLPAMVWVLNGPSFYIHPALTKSLSTGTQSSVGHACTFYAIEQVSGRGLSKNSPSVTPGHRSDGIPYCQ